MTLHSVIGADQVQDWRVSRSGRIATDQKAVQTRGPGRVVLGSKPQLATTEKLVSWAARDCQKTGSDAGPAAHQPLSMDQRTCRVTAGVARVSASAGLP